MMNKELEVVVGKGEGEVYGRAYAPTELRALVGDMSALAGVRLVEYEAGRARGVRAAQVWTGSGFSFQVLLDRALDIGAAEYRGRSLAWLWPALAAPAYYEPQSYGWMRTWGGGLVTTCGLTFFGQPEQDGSETLGLHGRVSHLPADNVRITTEWRGGDYVLEIEGEVRQVTLNGENLLLTRRIATRLGASSFTLTDRVTNTGFTPAPHMLLYHCNFGFPVVSPESELQADLESARPRDEAAARGLANHTRFEPPEPDYPEQVFFLTLRAGPDGYARAAIVNPALGQGGFVRWRAAELPCLGQWKKMQSGIYACALEPATNFEAPRARLRAEGRLRMLAPGEQVEYVLELGAVEA